MSIFGGRVQIMHDELLDAVVRGSETRRHPSHIQVTALG